MVKIAYFITFGVLSVASVVLADAESAAGDKSGFTLFNPVPAALMREFSPDRPDVTESPYTVDAGHFQLEFSFLEFTHDRDRAVSSEGYSVLPANLKVGLLNNLDLELIVEPYDNIRTGTHRRAGAGDTEVRAKLNLWGNDGGETAGGIMPFVRLPTGTDGLSDHHIEGGLILPLAVELPHGFDLGTMAEFDLDRNGRDDGYGVDFVHTATLDHNLIGPLDGYIEYVGVSPIDTGQTYLAYFDTGIIWSLGKDVSLDLGINVGLSRRADDFTTFLGMSIRI